MSDRFGDAELDRPPIKLWAEVDAAAYVADLNNQGTGARISGLARRFG